MTLNDARERREAARKLLANGVDLSESRKAEKASSADRATSSFEVISREWFAKCTLRLAPMLFVRPVELRHAELADIELEAAEWRYTVTKTKIAAAFDYRLGNRSALEWVIDQYRVSTDSRSGIVNDPNREDDPKYILRLVGQVITVSLETQQIVSGFASLGLGSD